MNLNEKTFIVTGASSGIGACLSKKLAQNGANVVCAARREEELDRVVKDIHAQGGTAISVPTDITKLQECEYLVEKTIDRFGKLDALVLNAGVSMWTSFEELNDVSFFRELVETNYMGAVQCCHEALKHLKANNGLIVSCSTAQALIGFPNHSGYAASKHALHGFLESLDIEMSGRINFLEVIMGWIRDTELRSNAYGSDGYKLGTSKRKHSSQSVTLEDCVAGIIRGIEGNKKVLYIPGKLRLVPLLNVFFKGFLRRKVKKAVDDQSD